MQKRERCHFVWGRMLSDAQRAAQRAALEAWIGSADDEPPPDFPEPDGAPDWLFIPGCSSGAMGGPSECVCASMEQRAHSAEAQLSNLRQQLQRAHATNRENFATNQALRVVLRKRGGSALVQLAMRYARFRRSINRRARWCS